MQLVYANDFEAVKKIYIDVIENTPLIEQYARALIVEGET